MYIVSSFLLWEIDLFQYNTIQPKTKDLSTRLCRMTTEVVGFIPGALC